MNASKLLLLLFPLSIIWSCSEQETNSSDLTIKEEFSLLMDSQPYYTPSEFQTMFNSFLQEKEFTQLSDEDLIEFIDSIELPFGSQNGRTEESCDMQVDSHDESDFVLASYWCDGELRMVCEYQDDALIGCLSFN